VWGFFMGSRNRPTVVRYIRAKALTLRATFGRANSMQNLCHLRAPLISKKPYIWQQVWGFFMGSRNRPTVVRYIRAKALTLRATFGCANSMQNLCHLQAPLIK